MRHLWIISLLFYGHMANADSLNLAIPGLPQNYQSDRFRAGELDCQNAIGSATQLEFGVTGLINDDITMANTGVVKDVGVYGRITMPLGKRVKERIDCNRLFELELKRKELEIQKLEQELQQLRVLQFEN